MATSDGPFCRICGQYGHTEYVHGSTADPVSTSMPVPLHLMDTRPIEEKIQELASEISESEWTRLTREDKLRKQVDTFFNAILKLLREKEKGIPRDRVEKFLDTVEDLVMELSNHSIEGKLYKKLENKIWKQIHWFRNHGIPYKTVGALQPTDDKKARR